MHIEQKNGFWYLVPRPFPLLKKVVRAPMIRKILYINGSFQTSHFTESLTSYASCQKLLILILDSQTRDTFHWSLCMLKDENDAIPTSGEVYDN